MLKYSLEKVSIMKTTEELGNGYRNVQSHRRRRKRGDLHTVRPEPTSGREPTERRQNTTEEYRRIKKRRLEASARS
jgi:hypothetical protein